MKEKNLIKGRNLKYLKRIGALKWPMFSLWQLGSSLLYNVARVLRVPKYLSTWVPKCPCPNALRAQVPKCSSAFLVPLEWLLGAQVPFECFLSKKVCNITRNGLQSSIVSNIVVLPLQCTYTSIVLNNWVFTNISVDYFLPTNACSM